MAKCSPNCETSRYTSSFSSLVHSSNWRRLLGSTVLRYWLNKCRTPAELTGVLLCPKRQLFPSHQRQGYEWYYEHGSPGCTGYSLYSCSALAVLHTLTELRRPCKTQDKYSHKESPSTAILESRVYLWNQVQMHAWQMCLTHHWASVKHLTQGIQELPEDSSINWEVRETQSLDNDIQGIVLHGKMKRHTKSWSGHETGSYVHVPYKQYNASNKYPQLLYYILILWKILYSNWYCINCSLRNKSQWHTRGWLRTPPQPLNGRLMPWFYIWIKLASILDALNNTLISSARFVQTARDAQTRSPSTPDCVLCALPNLPAYQALARVLSPLVGNSLSHVQNFHLFYWCYSFYRFYPHAGLAGRCLCSASGLTFHERPSRPSSISGLMQTVGGWVDLETFLPVCAGSNGAPHV